MTSNIQSLPSPPILPSNLSNKGKSKYQLLSDWRSHLGWLCLYIIIMLLNVSTGLNNTPSISILRDLVYILQGIDGHYFKFESNLKNSADFKLVPIEHNVCWSSF